MGSRAYRAVYHQIAGNGVHGIRVVPAAHNTGDIRLVTGCDGEIKAAYVQTVYSGRILSRNTAGVYVIRSISNIGSDGSSEDAGFHPSAVSDDAA